jgi:hypothetical protein
MPPCFFDTSALVPRYRAGKYTYRVNQVFGGPKNIFVAEITMVEIVSAFGSICRGHKLPDSDFEQMNAAFLDDIAIGRIQIRLINRSDMIRARHLLSLAGIVNRRNLGSSDALIAVSCRELALETHERVMFYTKDWTLYSTLYQINAYRSALRMRFLGLGRGGVPPTSN